MWYGDTTNDREVPMPRPKTHQSSADIDAQIHRLEEEKRRLIVAEDQRRGAIIRDCLAGPTGEDLRLLLAPVISPREASLFGIEPTASAGPKASVSNARTSSKPRRPTLASGAGESQQSATV